MLHTSASLIVPAASAESQEAFKETNTAPHCSTIQIKMRMTMQGDFECLLDDDGLKHINTQIQRRSEQQGRTLGFKDSNLNNLVMFTVHH